MMFVVSSSSHFERSMTSTNLISSINAAQETNICKRQRYMMVNRECTTAKCGWKQKQYTVYVQSISWIVAIYVKCSYKLSAASRRELLVLTRSLNKLFRTNFSSSWRCFLVHSKVEFCFSFLVISLVSHSMEYIYIIFLESWWKDTTAAAIITVASAIKSWICCFHFTCSPQYVQCEYFIKVIYMCYMF